jgi:hypothetical protein
MMSSETILIPHPFSPHVPMDESEETSLLSCLKDCSHGQVAQKKMNFVLEIDVKGCNCVQPVASVHLSPSLINSDSLLRPLRAQP